MTWFLLDLRSSFFFLFASNWLIELEGGHSLNTHRLCNSSTLWRQHHLGSLLYCTQARANDALEARLEDDRTDGLSTALRKLTPTPLSISLLCLVGRTQITHPHDQLPRFTA